MKFTILSIVSIIGSSLSVPTNRNGPLDEVVLDKRGVYPIPLEEYWTPFSFCEVGPGNDLFSLVELSNCVYVDVTDGFCWGDQFEARHSNFTDGLGLPGPLVSLGNTSLPGKSECGGPGSGDAAFSDPDMSSGSFLLLPGDHYIRLNVLLSPFGGGGAFIRARQTECPFSCDGRSNGYQQCKSSHEYHECSWDKKLTRPVSPGTECCDWTAAERVLMVAENSTCPF